MTAAVELGVAGAAVVRRRASHLPVDRKPWSSGTSVRFTEEMAATSGPVPVTRKPYAAIRTAHAVQVPSHDRHR